MRLITLGMMAACFAGCGNNNETPADLSTGADMSAAVDMVAGGDMAVTPFNMPGKVYCYDAPLCTTPGATSVCCDARVDGGFTDSCVASAQACTNIDPSAHAYACGQAADCPGGQICCGATSTSGTGKMSLAGSTCMASCPAGQTQLCVTASECKTGTHCTGADITGRDVGLCQ
jgi:hypothetical protein